MSRHSGENKVVESPLGPGFFATCPACKKPFALEYLKSRDHPIVKQVKTYRCRWCGHEVEFAKERPPQAI